MCFDILFKFRPITTVKQLTRLIDSLNYNRIFFPDYKKLNDPLESSGYAINTPGLMGDGARQDADEENPIIKNLREQFKILSLTENCFSPCMWAHYTYENNGVCIGYWKKDVIAEAQKIKYVDQAVSTPNDSEYGTTDQSVLNNEVYNSFFYKHSDWSYEKEWRIVKEQEDSYLNYSEDVLACIIFGQNLSQDIREIIIKSINKKVPMFYTKTGYRSFGINLLPIAFEIVITGPKPPFIRNIDELKEAISNQT